MYKQTIKVITNEELSIHASGHAKKEELKFLINLVKPTFFIPVHGENSMLFEHSVIARNIHIPQDNVFILENGSRLELSKYSAKILDKIKTKQVYIEGDKINDITEEIISERQVLGENGILNVVIIFNKNDIHEKPGLFISSKGFINRSGYEDLINTLKSALYNNFKSDDEIISTALKNHECSVIKKISRKTLRECIYLETKKNPLFFIDVFFK
jgi:ribonuclease J